MENSRDFKKLGKEFEILANVNRLEILKYLKNNNQKSVGDIADRTSLSFKTTSRQLLYLAKKGILKRHYDGNFVLYEIAVGLPKSVHLIISKLL